MKKLLQSAEGGKRWRVLVVVIFSIMLSSVLEGESYAQMSCYKLWYSRDLIFAEKGYCFTSAEAISVFGRRCYPPYGRLSRWEENEVENIKYWERRKGCPSHILTSYSSYNNGGSAIGYARVSGIRFDDTLAVRSGPSTQYMRIGELPPNAVGIEILECRGRWCRIRYGRLVGWSYAKYLRTQ